MGTGRRAHLQDPSGVRGRLSRGVSLRRRGHRRVRVRLGHGARGRGRGERHDRRSPRTVRRTVSSAPSSRTGFRGRRVAVEQRHPRDRADDSPVDRSRASRSTRRGTRPRWRRARRNAPALGQNYISPSLGLVRRCFSENAQQICRFASSRASAKKSARLPRETSSKNALAD